MRKLFLYIAAFLFIATPLSFGQANSPDILASGQTTTGDSASTCTSFGFERFSVFFIISGTASVDIECDDGSGEWYTLTGDGLPVTAAGNSVRAVNTFACARVRTDVTACTGCNVTTKCQKWKSGR